eukprot:6214414-Pleurochrysis_carterae.AAC.2
MQALIHRGLGTSSGGEPQGDAETKANILEAPIEPRQSALIPPIENLRHLALALPLSAYQQMLYTNTTSTTPRVFRDTRAMLQRSQSSMYE